jgi:DNA-binding winged helix-turn-helix (wHTH) protein
MGAATHVAVIEDGELGRVDNDDYATVQDAHAVAEVIAAAEASAASGTWQAVPRPGRHLRQRDGAGGHPGPDRWLSGSPPGSSRGPSAACRPDGSSGPAAPSRAAAPAGHNPGMRFGILGPTQVRRGDGREITVGGPRLRALLALLLVDAGKVVTVERLIDGVYGGNPPGEATNALQSQVSRLRHLLRDEDRPGSPVEFHPAGYRLAVDADEVDAHRFERLAAEGRRALAAGDPPRAASLLREALDLWPGPALADVGDVPFAQAQAVRLEELRVSAVEDRVEAELALGGPPRWWRSWSSWWPRTRCGSGCAGS